MAKQWLMSNYNNDGNKLDCTYVAVGAETAGSQISLYIGDAVPEYRQSEIKNAWKWLYEGIKSRNLLDDQFKGSLLYTAADINAITINNRRTSTELTPYTDTDVIIGIGANVTALGDTNILEAAIQQLIEFAAEETLKAA